MQLHARIRYFQESDHTHAYAHEPLSALPSARHAAHKTAVGEVAPQLAGCGGAGVEEELMGDQAEKRKPGPQDRRLEWAKVFATLTDALTRVLELLRR